MCRVAKRRRDYFGGVGSDEPGDSDERDQKISNPDCLCGNSRTEAGEEKLSRGRPSENFSKDGVQIINRRRPRKTPDVRQLRYVE